MLTPHIDNLLDLVSTSGKQGMTQTTGLPQGDKSDGNLTEGRLVGEGEKKKKKVLLFMVRKSG